MTRLFDDTTTMAIEYALRGVSRRQQTSADNIANVNTPGFRSNRVDFEDELARALRTGGDINRLDVEIRPSGNPMNVRGNDVALEEESTDLIQAGIQYEALVNALNHKFGVLRYAIGRQ